MGEVTAIGCSEHNLMDHNTNRSSVYNAKPDMITNSATYITVDKAESEPELAMAISCIAPCILDDVAALLKATLFYSTDYVFDGSSFLGTFAKWGILFDL